MPTRRAPLLALLAVAALGGCVGDDDTGRENARKGGSIAVLTDSAPRSLDPATASSAVERRAVWLAYTPPLTYRRAEGRDGTTPVPGLAERLPRVSANGLTYRFRFRRGLRYSNGTRLRASDFPHALERARRLSRRAARLYGGIEAIRADDRARTVTIRLRAPDGAFPNVLAATSSGLVPGRTPYRGLAGRPPPGIGPYRVASARPGRGFVLRRDRRFHLSGIPGGNVDEVSARVEPDAGRRARAVIGGRADSMQGRSPAALLPELRSKYRDRYAEHPRLATHYVFFDTRRRPFDSEKARRAVAFALDGKALRRLSDGFLAPGCNVLPPAMPGRRALDPCPYGDRGAHPDLVKASRLLGDSGEHRARVSVRPGGDPRVTRDYVATLRKIGLRARLARRGRALTGVREAAAGLPHPASLFEALRVDDPDVGVDTAFLRAQELGGAQSDWAKLDERVVRRALAAPFGAPTEPTFLSERMDAQNCALYQPVYGLDYSSLCLK